MNICTIDPEAQICIGCWRTLDEIAAWSGMPADARRAVMTMLPSRAADFTGRRTAGGQG
ncbi:MAG: DUF1289 domain-containing protein [Pseudorhodobacter sp.]